MLNLSFLDFVLRTIPEGVIYIFALYVFAGKKIDVKQLLYSSLILSVYTFLVRAMPIAPYVHTILFLIGYIVIAGGIIKIKMVKAISFCLVSVIILSISEILNMFLVSSIFGIPLPDVQPFMLSQGTLFKILCGLPSLFILLLVVCIVGFVKKHLSKKAE